MKEGWKEEREQKVEEGGNEGGKVWSKGKERRKK